MLEDEPEEYVKQKYSREDEIPIPWNLQILCSSPLKEPFYPCSDFGVHKKLLGKPVPINFPSFLYLSLNYYHHKWSFKTYRRIKNVIIVMDWVPNATNIMPLKGNHLSLTQNEKSRLDSAISLFGIKDEDVNNFEKLKSLFTALDLNVQAEEEQIKKILKDANIKNVEDLKQVIIKHIFYRFDSGRYYVALSLLEAETLRAILHMTTEKTSSNSNINEKLFQNCSFALRTGNIILDNSPNFVSASSYQTATAIQSFRFINSEIDFNRISRGMLIRSLQSNPCEDRSIWYQDVRMCRRRKQMALNLLPIQSVFTVLNEYELLENDAMIIRIQELIKTKGLKAHDAFRLFNADKSGLMTCSELYGGIEWLGLSVTPDHIYNLVRSVDTDHDGLLTLEDFKSAFDSNSGTNSGLEISFWDWEGGDEDYDEAHKVKIIPKNIPELHQEIKQTNETDKPEIMLETLKLVKIKVHKQEKFVQVWNSHGTMSRTSVSVWAPDIDLGLLIRNKRRICLGYYGNSGFTSPANDKKTSKMIIEITDTSQLRVQQSDYLQSTMDYLMPYPVRFRQIWNQQRGKEPFFAWKPIPPTADFVALGIVATSTEDPPPLNSIRCVPKIWLTKSSAKPELIWDDSGTGGRAGSIWTVTSFGFISVVQGHQPPEEEFYELKSKRFFLGNEELELIKSLTASSSAP
eukprot:c19785_g1_i2.p1 GENE.c19785_g1_i2~~c19785_g1_i2.p1  ORF type:complete len:774 (-),score=356.75 c19785_g1_i2:62-2122(-)